MLLESLNILWSCICKKYPKQLLCVEFFQAAYICIPILLICIVFAMASDDLCLHCFLMSSEVYIDTYILYLAWPKLMSLQKCCKFGLSSFSDVPQLVEFEICVNISYGLSAWYDIENDKRLGGRCNGVCSRWRRCLWVVVKMFTRQTWVVTKWEPYCEAKCHVPDSVDYLLHSLLYILYPLLQFTWWIGLLSTGGRSY